MTNKDKILYAGFFVLLIAVIVLLVSLFTRKKSDDNYKEVIQAKDETIKAIQHERDSYITQREELNSLIQDSKRKDSVLQVMYLNVKSTLQANTKKYESIPNRINSLSKDSLRRAIIEY